MALANACTDMPNSFRMVAVSRRAHQNHHGGKNGWGFGGGACMGQKISAKKLKTG